MNRYFWLFAALLFLFCSLAAADDSACGKRYSFMYKYHSGFYNDKGEVVIPPVYWRLGYFAGGDVVSYSYQNGQQGMLDCNGKETPLSYDFDDSKIGNGLFIFSVDGKPLGKRTFGIKDKDGNVVVPAVYDNAYPVAGGAYFFVSVGEKKGVVDRNGRVIVPIEYDCLSGEYAVKDRKLFLMKEDFTVDASAAYEVFSEVGKCTEYYSLDKNMLMAVKRDGKFGFVDRHNRVVIPFKFKSAEPFSMGLSLVNGDEGLGYVDLKGNMIAKGLEEGTVFFGDGVAVVRINGRAGLLKSDGRFLISPQYERIAAFVGVDLVFPLKNGKFSVYDPKTGFMSPFYIDEIVDDRGFFNEVFPIRIGKKFGVLGSDGREILPPQFDRVITPNDERYLLGVKGERYAIFSSQGKRLTDYIFDVEKDWFRDGGFIMRPVGEPDDQVTHLYDLSNKPVVAFNKVIDEYLDRDFQHEREEKEKEESSEFDGAFMTMTCRYSVDGKSGQSEYSIVESSTDDQKMPLWARSVTKIFSPGKSEAVSYAVRAGLKVTCLFPSGHSVALAVNEMGSGVKEKECGDDPQGHYTLVINHKVIASRASFGGYCDSGLKAVVSYEFNQGKGRQSLRKCTRQYRTMDGVEDERSQTLFESEICNKIPADVNAGGNASSKVAP